jgi:hypothetical protein
LYAIGAVGFAGLNPYEKTRPVNSLGCAMLSPLRSIAEKTEYAYDAADAKPPVPDPSCELNIE